MPHAHPALAALALLVARDGSLEAATGGTGGPDLTRYLLVCAGLLLLVGGLSWAARRFLARTLKARAGKRALQVMDLLPLGGRQRLAVVRCYDRTFLLGLGDKEISLVSELDAALAEPTLGAAPSVEAQSFADLLGRARPRSADRPTLEREGILG